MKYPDKLSGGNFRELISQKANYSAKGQSVKLRWSRGVFEAMSTTVVSEVDSSTLPRTEDAVDQAVLFALATNPRERLVLARNSPYFAPRRLKELDPETLAPFAENEVRVAIDRLITTKKIRTDVVGTGANSRKFLGFSIVPLRQNRSEQPQSEP